MLIHTSHYFYKLLNNSIMKTLKMIKRWILISIVFVGMSLTAYAVASTVIIRSITLNSVSTTTAEIIVEHIGIEGIYWGIWIDGCDEIYDFGLCTEVTGPDEHGYYHSSFVINNLIPGSPYELIVIGYEDIDDTENSAYQSGSITFETASIPSN